MALVGRGMSPMDAIEAVTSTSARLLGADDTLGALRPCYAADLVLGIGDPLLGIVRWSAPKNIALVAQLDEIRKYTLPIPERRC